MLPNLSMQELIIFGGIAIMLFGKRLPEVAKSLGSSYRQFREGLADFQRQMDMSSTASTTPSKWSQPKAAPRDSQAPTAPKFEPPALPVARGVDPGSLSRGSESQPTSAGNPAAAMTGLAGGEPSNSPEHLA